VFDAVFTDVGIQIVKIPANITEWWWAESPERRLVFRSDIPKTPRALPRYLSAELDRRLTCVARLAGQTQRRRAFCSNELPGGASANCQSGGDCVHEIPGQGAWLKVPLGKLQNERDGSVR
jgi:P2-related tail formation protein